MDSFPIIFENNEIILIHKKSGVPVQGGAGIKHSVDVDLSKQVGQKIFLVHRLDRETEGILCVAKNQAAAAKYTKLFSSKEIKKEYEALCFGKPEKNEGRIDFPILKDGRSQNATTHFKVLESVEKEVVFSDENGGETSKKIVVTKFHLKIDTGRTHQIRIHLSKIGCPIIGDDKHGDFKMNKIAKKAFKIKSLCLAAVKLTLPDGTFSLQKDLFSDIIGL